jgi:hypothetical protein
LKFSESLSNCLSTCTLFFFVFFPFFGFFPQDSPILQTNVRDERTPCFLIIEVVASKHLSLFLSHLRHHLGQWGCYGWININRYYGIEFHSWFNKISSLGIVMVGLNIIRYYDIEFHSRFNKISSLYYYG